MRRLGLALAAVIAAGAAAGCAGTASQRPAAVARPQRAVASSPAAIPAASSPTPAPSPSLVPVPAPPPGLPQTRVFPSAGTPAFQAEMTDLWTAVTAGKPADAAGSFFPLTAYEKVKAIADPAADWHARLFGDFALDVAAAHRYLGAGPARLLRVIVPSAQAAWIDPGVCENAVGYWHVAGARLVYRQGGQVRSIGIASLISWRGQWYVVHFGAVLRPGTSGVVDAPAAGPGVPGPPGGC